MNLELFSERLALIPFAPTDPDLCLEMFTDPKVLKYSGPMTRDAYGEDGLIFRITRSEWFAAQDDPL